MGKAIIIYFSIAAAFIFVFEKIAKEIIKDGEAEEDPDYLDAVSFLGEHNVFVLIWAFMVVIWPLTILSIASDWVDKIRG